jgi:hypothetical protein
MEESFVLATEDIFNKAEIAKILKGCQFKYVGKQVDGYQDWPGLEVTNGRKYIDKIPGKTYLVVVNRHYKGKAGPKVRLSDCEELGIAFMQVFSKCKKYQTYYLAYPGKGTK